MNARILIVDDDLVNRKIVAAIVRKAGYKAVEAGDGDEAIRLALRDPPDLILLDIMMPQRDGYQVCAALKRDGRSRHIPIIFFSSRAEVEDKIKGLDLGGADYITKPFDSKEILARVRAHLKIQTLTKQLMEANQELMRRQQSLDQDLKAAAAIQRSLLPASVPHVDAIDWAWRFMPCRTVGGDIFNVFRLQGHRWGMYMLDVSGHGVPAAMVAVSVSQMLSPQTGYLLRRSENGSRRFSAVRPSKVLSLLDRAFPFDRFEMYFTISYLIFNQRDGTLKYSNAAHPPPLLLHRDGSIEPLDEGGTVIGLGGILPFREGVRRLRRGDKLIVYTDGILEYRNDKGDFYGKDRLFSRLSMLREESISRTIDALLGDMMRFGGHAEPGDDISLMGLEYKGPSA